MLSPMDSVTADNGCFLDDDGGSAVIAVEAADSQGHRQSFEVRVGPVFYGSSKAAAEPGIWICYQEEHQHSRPAGPVLLTPAVWREMARAVELRLTERE
jgi:hypothetical protein